MAVLIDEAAFLAGPDSGAARLLHITGAAGSIRCSITSYGARLVSCIVPAKSGEATDVVLGYGTLAGYRRQPEDYMGAIVGRCANRIAGGVFSIGGTEYHTTRNEGANTLHGGDSGLHGRTWSVLEHTADSVRLGLESPDGAEGFPGNLSIEVTYRILADSRLVISYRATTDAPTPVNLSNHAYWNLSGEGSATVEDHLLQLNAAAYTPVDAALIPTGVIVPVAGSAFDFRKARAIGAHIDDGGEQLHRGKGYDHNWVADGGGEPVAVLSSPVSGITLRLFSSAPGMQFYSGNGLDGTRTGKSRRQYGCRSALVLEPQAYPDSLHHPGFPNVVLLPGDVYHREDSYCFS